MALTPPPRPSMFCVTPDLVIMSRACNKLGANGSQACQYTVRLGHWWGYGRVMWFLERYENPPPFGLLALTGNSNPEMMSVSLPTLNTLYRILK